MKPIQFSFSMIAVILFTLTAPIYPKNIQAAPLPTVPASAPNGTWNDNFDSYPTGQNLHGIGGWKGFHNNPTATAYTSNAQARSTPNSVDIYATSDLVHEYDTTSGLWLFTAWQYLPGNFQGQSYFIMMNEYDDSGIAFNVSTQVVFDSVTGLMTDEGTSGASMPYVTDQWIKIQIVINLDSDTQAFYYNNILLYSGTWSDHVSGGGALAIRAVDLFANGANSLYYDDMSWQPGGGNFTVGTGTPGSCAEGNFDTALTNAKNSGGGTITFNCGGAVSIVFTAGKVITNAEVTINGGGNITLSGGNTIRPFYVDSNATLTLQNITISNGLNTDYGGGALLNLGPLTLENTTVRDSNVDPGHSGGAIMSLDAPVTITDSLIENNTGGSAGGLFLIGENVVATIQGSIIRNNHTTSGTYGYGGAISVWNGAVATIHLSTIELNEARVGGGIYNDGSEIELTESTLTENMATDDRGGGILNSNNGVMSLTNVTLNQNSSIYGGGIFNNFSGSISLLNVTLSNNVATQGGGLSNNGTLNFTNGTISGNSATSSAGGIYNSGTATLIHVTLSNNTANDGSAIFASSASGGTISLKNTIINGSGPIANCILSVAPITSGGFNLSSDNSCGLTQTGDQQSVDPLLGPLANNGGVTQTHIPLPESTAINGGQCVTGVTTDQRGVSRPQGPACDIGAVERQPSDSGYFVYLPLIIK